MGDVRWPCSERARKERALSVGSEIITAILRDMNVHEVFHEDPELRSIAYSFARLTLPASTAEARFYDAETLVPGSGAVAEDARLTQNREHLRAIYGQQLDQRLHELEVSPDEPVWDERLHTNIRALPPMSPLCHVPKWGDLSTHDHVEVRRNGLHLVTGRVDVVTQNDDFVWVLQDDDQTRFVFHRSDGVDIFKCVAT